MMSSSIKSTNTTNAKIKIIMPIVTVGYQTDANLYKSKLPGSIIVMSKDVAKNPTYSLVNLHISVVPSAKVMRTARINIFMVNHELGKAYYSPPHNRELERMDMVLCKNRASVETMQALKRKYKKLKFEIRFTKHTTNFPEFSGDIIQDKQHDLVLHSAGWHQWKQTGKILSTWIKYPTLPKIVITCTDNCISNLRDYFKEDVANFDLKDFPHKLPKNIEFHTKPIDYKDLVKLKHKAGIHLCPSLIEGYGHYIVESMVCKSITITTDHPPMNELINRDSGFLVKCISFMDMPFDVKACITSEDEIYNAVTSALNLKDNDRVKMGNTAYQQYLDERSFWNLQMDKLWQWIQEKAKVAQFSSIHRIRSQTGGDELISSMQEKIRWRIQHDLEPFKYTMQEFRKMEAGMWSTPKLKDEIMCIEIRDSIAHGRNIESPIENAKGHESRGAIVFELIRMSVEYMRTIGKTTPDCVMYVMSGDSYPYQFQDLPMFTIVKPEKRNGILIPDNTFIRHPPEVKEHTDWDTTKKMAQEFCKNVKRENIMFFKGIDSSVHRHNIRGIVKSYVSKDKELPLKVELVQSSSFEPVWEFCKYKYLLNLPGNQPWSFRKKFILMLPSLVIDVAISPYYGKDHPGEWVNFFDNIFVPSVDYAKITMEWDADRAKQLGTKQQEHMLSQLKQIYTKYEQDPELYAKTVKSANHKTELLSQKLIYRSIYSLIVHYADCVKRDGGPTKLVDILAK